uniref:Olfactory receptor n=1 Tax=Amphiprion percula TaxID=161767 RepID=A0A3P8TT07_AMPPE
MMNSTNFYFKLVHYFDLGVYKYLLFTFILSFYILIVSVNVFLIVIICMNRSLHEPMYLFLVSLFANELCGSTGLFPFLLVQILSDLHTVSASLCLLQVFCVYSYVGVGFFNLTIMSYDRYLAICRPLQYNTLMTPKKVATLTGVSWGYSLCFIAFMVRLSARLQLCGNIINNVYCDNYSLVKLACSDTTANNIYGLAYTFTAMLGLVILIVFSYSKILKVCFSGSKQTRQKAVSTCIPHLASLLNFSCGCFFEIVQSRFNMSNVPVLLRIFLSLYWICCQPLFNPVLYGLKMTKIHSEDTWKKVLWSEETRMELYVHQTR